MSDSDRTDQQLSEISGLFKRHLGIRGPTIAGQIKRARRHLPAAAHEAVEIVSEAESLTGHPRLRLMIDEEELEHATAALRSHLRQNNLTERRGRFMLGLLRSFAFNILVVIVLLVAVLYWRGYIQGLPL